jgi:hypothetical protein
MTIAGGCGARYLIAGGFFLINLATSALFCSWRVWAIGDHSNASLPGSA